MGGLARILLQRRAWGGCDPRDNPQFGPRSSDGYQFLLDGPSGEICCNCLVNSRINIKFRWALREALE